MRWWPSVVVLAGCNVVFGLDRDLGAPPDPVDRDGDGVADEEDVCPEVADPAQADGDDDGSGDACDACPADPMPGDEHDEDGDRIADRCDNCPHVANRDQANAGDLDELGDACDPDAELQCIAYFTPFRELPGTSFFTHGQWSVADDRLVHPMAWANHELLAIDATFVLPTVEIAGRVTTLPTSLPEEPSIVSVFAAMTQTTQPGTANGLTTRLTQAGTANPQPYVQALRVLGASMVETPPIVAIGPVDRLRTVDAPFVVRQTMTDADTFVASGALDGASATTGTTNVSGYPPGAVGIHTYNLGVEIDYLLVTQACGASTN